MYFTKPPKHIFSFLLLLLGLFALPSMSAKAADICVDNSNGLDGVEAPEDCLSACGGAGACDIRDAIAKAEGTAGDDVIIFDDTVTSISTDSSLDFNGTDADTVTVQGPGASILTIQNNGTNPVFYFGNQPTGNHSLSNMTILGGTHGIWVNDINFDLTLDSLAIVENHSTDTGGGLNLISVNAPHVVTVSNSIIKYNVADERGAGIYVEAFDVLASLSIQNTQIDENDATGGLIQRGGGLACVDSTISIHDSSLSFNTAVQDGAGIFADLGCSLTITESEINHNIATDNAGAIYMRELLGSGETISLSLSDSEVIGNVGSAGPSGIELRNASFTMDLDLTNVTFAANAGTSSSLYISGDDAAIANTTINITNSTFSDNNSSGTEGGGGAIDLSYSTGTITGSVFYNNISGDRGGAINVFSSDLSIVDSAIINNTSLDAGGAIYNSSTLIDATSLQITNSTISGNISEANGGGAIYNNGDLLNTVTLLNTTIVNNLSDGNGGGGGLYQADEAGTVTVTNSIVARNSVSDSIVIVYNDCSTFGTDITSGGNNFIGTDDTCANNTFDASTLNDQVGTGTLAEVLDPDLAELSPANGGDPTNGIDPAVHVPNTGSPVIDAGNNAEAPDTDQRGVARPIDGDSNGTATADIGAVEAGCGDGIVQEGEECDDAGETATCNVSCSVTACGDGITNSTAGEVCDDAGESVDCNVTCTESICGDGVFNTTAGEACEDGNLTDGDGCDSSCQVEDALADALASDAVCGDSILQTGETCEDGNTTDGDGCDSSCQTEDALADALASDAVCGDSILQTGETCEDGNTTDGDGCDSTCQTEESSSSSSGCSLTTASPTTNHGLAILLTSTILGLATLKRRLLN